MTRLIILAFFLAACTVNPEMTKPLPPDNAVNAANAAGNAP